MLPAGVVPGAVKILNMENINLPNLGNAIEGPSVGGSESSVVPSLPEVAVASQIKTEVIDNGQQQPQAPARSGIFLIFLNGSDF